MKRLNKIADAATLENAGTVAEEKAIFADFPLILMYYIRTERAAQAGERKFLRWNAN